MRKLTICSLLLLAPLTGQTIETIGASNSCPAGSNRAKANQFRVDQSVLVLDFEVYLDVPQSETLTFFAYRHHSRTLSTLEWTMQVAHPGGQGGPSFFSTGPIALALTAGNYYAIGVQWSGSNTYCYSTNGATLSFGEWQRAHTINGSGPLPPTLYFAGNDGARYYQRFTTIPVTNVVNVGSSCLATPSQGAAIPRLVAAGFFPINATQNITLVDAAPSAIGVFALSSGPAVTTPIPVFGCDIWLNLSAFATVSMTTDIMGISNLPLAIPNNINLVGQSFTSQALVLGNGIDISHAVEFTIG